MDNTKAATWAVQSGGSTPHQRLDELVMAWGKDTQTGEARYIFELDESRRGARSGCVCYSCGKTLTAVNAAKAQWQIRPHFRHPDGAERNACLVLTARAAALSLLQEKDRIVLPARRVDVQVVGISGKKYNAWVTQPAQRVSIKSFKPRDQVSAVLTLEDGQEILVKLTGSLADTMDGEVLPVIQLVVDDPALAALDPQTLKSKLHLLVEAGTWCGKHWGDTALRAQAQQQAETAAADALDWLPKESVPELCGSTSQESVLHWLTKEILRQEGRLQVPAVVLREPWGGTPPKGYHEVARRPGSLLGLSGVRLERKVGHIRPDVLAEYVDPTDCARGVLLVEVTVTNEIVPERLARIRTEGLAALEINVGQLGGTLTRQDFTRLVTEELTVKKWLHHPWLAETAATRQAQLEEDARRDDLELANLKDLYCSAVEQLAALRAQDLDTPEARQERKDAREKVRVLGSELALYGYEGADDPELYSWHGCILDRLLSIQDNHPVGYRLDTLWQVLNTALSEKASEKLAWHTLYLSALKAYAPELEPRHRARVAKWRDEVKADLEECRQTGRISVYLRNRKFDPLLGFLFPAMRRYLEMPLPGEKGTADINKTTRKGLTSNEGPLSSQELVLSRGWWLEGEELESWKLQNPEAAQAWDASRRP